MHFYRKNNIVSKDFIFFTSILLTLSSAVKALIYLVDNQYVLFMTTNMTAIIFTIPVILQRGGKYYAAKIFFFTSITFICTIFSIILGKGYMLLYGTVATFIFGLLLAEKKKESTLYILSFLIAMLISLFGFYNEIVLYKPQYSDTTSPLVSFVHISLIVLAVFFYRKYLWNKYS